MYRKTSCLQNADKHLTVENKRQSQYKSSGLIPQFTHWLQQLLNGIHMQSPGTPALAFLMLSLNRQGFTVIRHSCALTHSVPNPNLNISYVPLSSGFWHHSIRKWPPDVRTLWSWLSSWSAVFYLSWKLAFLFSTNAVMPSLRSSCREKHRHTHHDWTIYIKVPLHSLSALLLTVAKVAWNKRFSKRLPSAKVSS